MPRRLHLLVLLTASALILALSTGCPTTNDTTSLPVFNNTTDPTNSGATYIGSAACAACHSDVAAETRYHGHSYALNAGSAAAPDYPAAATRAGVPNPPTGFAWSDISYIISGYTKGAFFVDDQGYIMTTGVDGANTQFNLDYPPNGTAAGFVSYLPDQTTPLPFDYETCFRCHTTGPQAQSTLQPLSQDGRPGILGTWAEDGVQCEACHGPGSNHAPHPTARNIYVDGTNSTCANCHLAGNDTSIIKANDGYIKPYTQIAELRASGGHADFTCTVCHDGHASATYATSTGIRNTCTACHTDANMASHAGAVFTRGDYREELTCLSCHMPWAGRSNSSADVSIVGTAGRMGDVRSHIFRVDTDSVTYNDMLTPDGTQVRTDSAGCAGVSIDFVCLRCHTDEDAATNSAFPLPTQLAAEIATGLHTLAD